MKQSKMFEAIKGWYENGNWNKKQVKNAVGKKITEAEYELITGEKLNGGESDE